MRLLNIFSYFIIFSNVIGLNLVNKNLKTINKNINLNINIQKIHNDLGKMSLLSKIIYDYDYNEKNKKNELNSELKLIRCNNFNCVKLDYLDILYNSELYKNYDSKNRLQSIILINHKLEEIIVIFRGSNYLNEWIKNLEIKESTLDFNKKFKIHKGIYQMYKENNLFLYLSRLYNSYPNYRKIFTGHSRGAINSILSVLELDSKLDNNYNYEIFGFGTPPIFNFELSNYLNKKENIKIYNVVNHQDIITLLKLKNKYHVGEEIDLNKNNISIKKHDNPYIINNNCIKFNNLLDSIKNHDLCNYIENIFNNLKY